MVDLFVEAGYVLGLHMIKASSSCPLKMQPLADEGTVVPMVQHLMETLKA